MERIGMLVVGAGRIAQEHFQAIRDNPATELVAVVDPDERQLKRVRGEDTVRYAGTDLVVALEQTGVDAVIIAAPTHLHAGLATTALAHGCHVLVEKPLAVNVAEARAMIQAARKAERLLMGAQIVRFMPMFQAARAFVAGGGLGRCIHFIERRLTHRTEVFPWWRELPHFLIGHWGSHSVDMLLWLLGERAEQAFCQGSSEIPGYDGVDDFTLHLKLSGGGRATFHQSFSSRFSTHDMVLIGSEATLTFDCYRCLQVNGRKLVDLEEREMLRAGFAGQLAAFVAGIRGERPVEGEAQSVLPSMVALDGAVASLQSGQLWQPSGPA